jgi:alpha-N-arabinofuranosidase
VHGPWQVGHLSAADYTKQAARWAHALRLVDPSIKLVSCGNQGNSEWDREVLQGLIGVCDYHSIHFYSMLGHERFAGPPGLEYEKNVFGPIVSHRGVSLPYQNYIWTSGLQNADELFSIVSRHDPPQAAERGIEICSSLIDLAKIHHSLNPDQYKFGLPDSMSINSGILKREMKICYDEWNV